MPTDPPPPISAVAFDMDGLIFDTEALFFRVAGELLAARGKAFTSEMMTAMIGRPAAVTGPTLVAMAGLDEPPEAIMAEARRRFDALVDTAIHPMPGLFSLLGRLEEQGIPRAVATSTRRAYALRLLGNHGLIEHFAFVLGGDEVTRGKPDPEIYETAASRLGVDPSTLLVLEDSPAGVASARAAGAYVVAIPHDHSPAPGLAAAHLLADRLDDPRVLALLDG
ncbi:HAD family hydrolase [Tautonia plasticadhaerens]|uniref:Phosphorylated carbohydrates phosphatase n=1 Tax=Tautonia plasticadhaerens TaxID=2527974 RepID=A0A518GX67_9BACT|nr:HAD family phosphatase [Tautonia plasticadhaerens]QDV33162.1 Phosphorylated carbohydrates phosphatase [Tautonia plasticadhaerens]